MSDRRSFMSKEDLTSSISKSVFVTNFPDHCTARDLWSVCTSYGKVIDVYIPLKKSKAGKKFAFVRFLKVDNLERLIDNICTIWIGRLRLHANPVRFQRKARVSNDQPKKENVGIVKKSFASVLKSNNSKANSPSDSTPTIMMDDYCIIDKDLSCSIMGKIKDINVLSNFYVILTDEGFDNVHLSYLGGFWVLIDVGSVTSKEKMIKHVDVASWFSELRLADTSFVSDDRLVWISVEGLPIITWNNNALAKIVSQWGTLYDVDTVVDPSLPFKKLCVVTKSHTIINDMIKIIIKGRIYWIRVKELEAWTPEFNNEFCENSSSDEESVKDEEINSHKVNDIDHVSKSSYMKENNEFENLSNVSKKGTQSDDLFGIYKILNRNKETEDLKGDDLTFPHGFTSKVADDKVGEDVADSVNNSNTNLHSNKDGVSSGKCASNRSFKLKSGGSILEVIKDFIEIGQAMGCNMEWCSKNIKAIVGLQGDSQVNFAAIQETKLQNIDLFSIKALWGNFSYDFAFSPSVGFYGGILCVWDPNMFSKDNVTISYSFLAVHGMLISSSTKMLIVSVYAPQDVSERKSLWEYINHMIDSWDASLIDLPLEGYSYTWALKSASKMSKLDRFLISKGLLSVYPSLSALCLNRRLSYQGPIIMRESVVDYGPTLFCVFHSWFTKDGFDKLVEDTWKNSSFVDSDKICLLRKKFQALKVSIKTWCKEDMQRSNESRFSIQSWISDLDKMLDRGMNMAQKAKIRWAIEGDENSKYFHGIINKKRYQLAIRGVLVKGEWIEDPCKVKNEFLNHFSNRFAMPSGLNISLESHMFNQISFDQNVKLESDVTYEEIMRGIIQQDVVNAVHEFLASSMFPPGSNSALITLIPKKLEAKVVKDFCPISLIGSFYKIVGKILANRLSLVMSDLINEGIRIDDSLTLSHLFYADDVVFIGKLDKANVITIVNILKCFFLASGLKINIHKSKIMGTGTTQDEVNSALNIIGCNTFSSPFNYLGVKKIMASRKKGGLGVSSFFAQNRALLFKWIWRFGSQVSSLWYRVIKAMFGERGSLDIPDKLNDNSITRSIKDLLVEDWKKSSASTRWVKEVLIKINILAWKVSLDKLPTRLNLSLRGIEIPSISCPICSFAGVKDVLEANDTTTAANGTTTTTVHQLQPLYQNAALERYNKMKGNAPKRINMNKSYLMGIFVDSNKVKHAAAKIGCLVLKRPFNYLGSRVGDLMCRIQSWHDVTERMHTQLSKWKLKTLSIGGRLTLLKSVLGAIPIYYMSIFKVPMKVLQNMKSIRACFFNGADVNSKKPSWVRWKSVLAAKDVGGLRALMFKWV
nr:RNA-directed DNA polymerase, eukaryota [Tanacetum cinerariifolium]